MRKLILCFMASACGAASVYADSFGQRLDRGYALLHAGDPDAALTQFHDLQTDEPESDLVFYSIASAQFAQGMRNIEADAPEDAVAKMTEAKATFEGLTASDDPFVHKNAVFNAANCSAQIAKQSAGMGQHEKTVAAFEESIMAYESVLRSQPNHTGARKNLDHMRYLLKSLLQNPPDEPPQTGENGEESDESEGEKSEDQQQGDQEDAQSEFDENQDSEPLDPNDEPQGGSEDEQDFSGQPSDQEMEPKELNRQNIEAILQSLEDQDREEQKSLRRAKGPPIIQGGKWW